MLVEQERPEEQDNERDPLLQEMSELLKENNSSLVQALLGQELYQKGDPKL